MIRSENTRVSRRPKPVQFKAVSVGEGGPGLDGELVGVDASPSGSGPCGGVGT